MIDDVTASHENVFQNPPPVKASARDINDPALRLWSVQKDILTNNPARVWGKMLLAEPPGDNKVLFSLLELFDLVELLLSNRDLIRLYRMVREKKEAIIYRIHLYSVPILTHRNGLHFHEHLHHSRRS